MLAIAIGLWGYCDVSVRMHMEKMPGELWNEWYVFGDIHLYNQPLWWTQVVLCPTTILFLSSSFLIEPQC